MYDVELTYRTRMGNLICTLTTAETVETREEAELVRRALQARPELVNATVLVKRAKPRSTSDEALERFAKELTQYRPIQEE